MNQSHLCYRNLIDIILKLQIKNISLSDYGEVKKFLQNSQSDHIMLLPKMEQALKLDPVLTNVILSLLTQIKGPVSVTLFEQVAYQFWRNEQEAIKAEKAKSSDADADKSTENKKEKPRSLSPSALPEATEIIFGDEKKQTDKKDVEEVKEQPEFGEKSF